ncbi:MAG: hypothetical protein IJ518_04895 [Clostridia bacterium]|nr:hypothetical protein [Clostridia bacterium]
MKTTAILMAALLGLSLLAGCADTPAVSDPADSSPLTTTATAAGNTIDTDASTTGTAPSVGQATAEQAVTTASNHNTTATTPVSGPVSNTGGGGLTTNTTTANSSTSAAVTTTTTARRVELPSPGYDPDGKGRIQLGEVTLAGNTLTIVVKNVSKNWATDESTSFTYACYDAAGKELAKGTLYVGAVGAGKQQTCQLDIPTVATKVALTGFTAGYWTEWKK